MENIGYWKVKIIRIHPRFGASGASLSVRQRPCGAALRALTSEACVRLDPLAFHDDFYLM
jgi:hypothetical protein